jgi:hypothetical protein
LALNRRLNFLQIRNSRREEKSFFDYVLDVLECFIICWKFKSKKIFFQSKKISWGLGIFNTNHERLGSHRVLWNLISFSLIPVRLCVGSCAGFSCLRSPLFSFLPPEGYDETSQSNVAWGKKWNFKLSSMNPYKNCSCKFLFLIQQTKSI